MTALKILGIERITPKIIITSIGTLIWLGIATNGLFELWKELFTVFVKGYPAPGWKHIVLYLFPFFSFSVWVTYIYIKIKPIFEKHPAGNHDLQLVKPHKGIVLPLSKPQEKTPKEIIELIESTEQQNINLLYKERSIGQLFKGIYYHRKVLDYVWPLTTNDSVPYRECIKVFLNKFVPNAKIYEKDKLQNICHLTESDKSKIDEYKIIEETKSLLSHIYSNEHLSHIGFTSSDIIVDISGGTKPITIGLILGALNSSIDIQYVEQQSEHYDVIPLGINAEILLDKMGEYMLELYSMINKTEPDLFNIGARKK